MFAYWLAWRSLSYCPTLLLPFFPAKSASTSSSHYHCCWRSPRSPHCCCSFCCWSATLCSADAALLKMHVSRYQIPLEATGAAAAAAAAGAGRGREEAGGPLVAQDLQRPLLKYIYINPAQPRRVNIGIYLSSPQSPRRVRNDIYAGYYRKGAVCCNTYARETEMPVSTLNQSTFYTLPNIRQSRTTKREIMSSINKMSSKLKRLL